MIQATDGDLYGTTYGGGYGVGGVVFRLSLALPILRLPKPPPPRLVPFRPGPSVALPEKSVDAAGSEHPALVRSGSGWVVLAQSPINGKVSTLATDMQNAVRPYAYGLGDVFRSDDFGQMCSSLNQDLKPRILRVYPTMPDRLYVVSGGSVWRSGDAGATWNNTAGPPKPVTTLVVDAAGIVYAAGSEGAFSSATAGDSWSPVSPIGGFDAADPVTPGVLYGASCEGLFPFLTCKEFRTTDGASSGQGRFSLQDSLPR